jgi:hypothetical protein
MVQQFAERRQHIRVPLTYVTVEVYSSSNKKEIEETCSVVDISVNGMKLITQSSFQISQRLLVTFVLPGSTIPIRANAAVIYQQSRDSLLHTGIQFTDLGLVEFALLKKYIEIFDKKN